MFFLYSAVGRFRTGMSRTTYNILQHFSVWWPQIKRNEVMFCFILITMGRYIAIFSWSDFIFLWNTSYGTQRNPQSHAPFFFFFQWSTVHHGVYRRTGRVCSAVMYSALGRKCYVGQCTVPIKNQCTSSLKLRGEVQLNILSGKLFHSLAASGMKLLW